MPAGQPEPEVKGTKCLWIDGRACDHFKDNGTQGYIPVGKITLFPMTIADVCRNCLLALQISLSKYR